MTEQPRGPLRGVPRMWLVPLVALTGLLGITVAGVLSRSLALDLLAWWPIWATIAVVAIGMRRRRVGRVRLSGVVPLIALGALVTFTVAHIQGWAGLPSSEVRLVGPSTEGVETAELRARLEGRLVVGSGSTFLYVIEPVRRGGAVGVPGAVEESTGEHISVVLGATGPPGLYGFAGWSVQLAASPRWSLDLEGDLDADLDGLTVGGISASGSGVLRIGRVSTETQMRVEGDFELVVPERTAVRITGPADVPSSWTSLADGWQSPTAGSGWVIEVLGGGTLIVTEG